MKQQSESSEIIDSVPEEPVTTKPRDGIQWGGVIKGVAIVAAVALVGVAAFWLANAAAVAALGVPQVAGAAQAVITATAPIANMATGVVTYLTGFLPHVPNIIGGFFSNMFGMEAAGAAAAGTATLSAANSGAIANAIGGLGSGAALAGGAVLAAPAIQHAMIPDPSHAAAGHVAGMDAGHGSHTTTDILKTSHVAAENSQAARAAQRAAALRAAQANQSWVERSRASRAEGGFAEQLNADRARLDAALADPTR